MHGVLPRGCKCCSPVMCECVWKNSTWLGTSMMINRETPLAEIVG